MFCPKCGKEINDSATFCPFCGQSITNNNANGDNNVKSKQGGNSKVKTIGIIAASIIVVVALGLFAISQFSKETSTVQKNVSSEDTVSETVKGINAQDGTISNTIDLISQAETINEQSYNELKELTETNISFQEEADIMAGAVEELSQIKKEFSQINGLDSKLQDACNEFFDMSISSREGVYRCCVFFAQYYKFDYAGRPETSMYESPSDYYNALNEWYETNKTILDSITDIPSSVETEWTEYKKIFEVNDDIVIKEYYAEQLNDSLRHNSAINLSNRYIVAEKLAYDAISNCLKEEFSFAVNQILEANKLSEEIHSYAGMDTSKRAEYIFEYDKNNKIKLNYETVESIYPSLYNTYNAFVIIKTGCLSGSRDIVVEAEIAGFTQKYKQSFKLGSSYKSIYIKPAPLSGEIDLSSSKDAQINVSIYEKDGNTLIDSQTFPVKLKSRNDFDWYSDDYGVSTQDNILCFLTPEAKSITELKRIAIDELSSMTGGDIEGFVGYQPCASETEVENGTKPSYLRNPYVITYLQCAGIMRALNKAGVRYNMDGFSISGSNQHILLPSEVLENRSGLCIETSLVVASALQSAGMHAFLIFPPGHAQVAVEIWSGKGEYFLIETTQTSDDDNNAAIFINGANSIINNELPSGPISYFNNERWNTYLESCDYIIDCDDSRLLGLTPFEN